MIYGNRFLLQEQMYGRPGGYPSKKKLDTSDLDKMKKDLIKCANSNKFKDKDYSNWSGKDDDINEFKSYKLGYCFCDEGSNYIVYSNKTETFYEFDHEEDGLYNIKNNKISLNQIKKIVDEYNSRYFKESALYEAKTKDTTFPTEINFFGEKFKVRFKNNFDNNYESDDLDLPKNVIDSMINIANTIGKRNDVFEAMYKNINIYDDEYMDRIKSGKDVINSIKNDSKNKSRGFVIAYNKDYKNDSHFYIYFCGEYSDIDEEHGFSIRFPNGKYDIKKLIFGGYSNSL